MTIFGSELLLLLTKLVYTYQQSKKAYQRTNNSKNKSSVCVTVLISSLSRLLASSSESGISDMELASTSATEKNEASTSDSGTKEVAEPLLLATHVEDDFEELSEEIPDPFSDDEGDIIELPNDPFLQQPIGMVTSITSMVNPDIEDDEEDEGEEKDDEGLTPIFVPSLSYLAQVSF